MNVGGCGKPCPTLTNIKESYLRHMLAVVIPCYKVRQQILGVIENIGPEVNAIYVVDDCCPQQSGEHVKARCRDSRVVVLTHEKNQGVGGATITGFQQAKKDRASIVVKVDGDGQMDPVFIPELIKPIQRGEADYTKGNRFYSLENLQSMPSVRIFGNSFLSFFSKMSSGYWRIMDPTNGYVAIRVPVLKMLPLRKLDRRYYFESDMLFRLNTIRAAVVDVPMQAKYGNEASSLRIWHSLITFFWKHLARSIKRIFYNYFLREFNPGSLELVASVIFITSGVVFGLWSWFLAHQAQVVATSGTVMIGTLPIIIGFQLFIAFVNFDIMNEPTKVLHVYQETQKLIKDSYHQPINAQLTSGNYEVIHEC